MIEAIYTFLLLAAGQGLFLALILATQKVNSVANRLLAVLMFAVSIFLCQEVYYARGYFQLFPHLIGVSDPVHFLFGPICYLYAEAVSEGHHTFRRRGLLHFIPFALVTLYYTPFYFSSGEAKLAFFRTLLREGETPDLAIIKALQIPQGLTYAALTVGLLRRHRSRMKEAFSSVEQINLIWLRDLTVGVAVTWGVATGTFLLDLGGSVSRLAYAITPMAVAILVYGVGYMGLRQPEILQPPPSRLPPVALPTEQRSYEKSGLTPEEADGAMARLRQVMEEERLYLRSTLTLQELADATGISPHNVSEVINTRAGRNLYDFVNAYRTEEAKRRLRDPKYANLTILALATDCGFNSKSVFNTFFKEYTGLTPSQYRNLPPDLPPSRQS